jgi:hypothetical protein
VLSNDPRAQGKTTTAGASPASWKAASLISLESLLATFSPPRKYSFIEVIWEPLYFKAPVLFTVFLLQAPNIASASALNSRPASK